MPETPVESRNSSNISHDLRTPLNHIIGYSELMAEEAEDNGQQMFVESLRSIRLIGKQLLGLLNDTFSSLKSGPPLMRLRKARTDLMMMADQVTAHTNALEKQVQRPDQAAFSADLHKIAAAVETFKALIDYALATEEVTPLVSRPALNAGMLLVVDDNVGNREVLSSMLERQGHTVVTAENGQRALDLLRAQTFDLVLLDILMPELDGFEVLRQLRASDTLRHVPVIVISALDDLDDVARCIELGAEDYLSKPFDRVLLRARIGASLERKRLRDQELAYLKQVDRLTYAASAVETDTFEPDSLVDMAARTDSLGQLARVFVHMAHEVYAREARLKHERFAVTINEAQKAESVAAITDTDYFQALRQKVQRHP